MTHNKRQTRLSAKDRRERNRQEIVDCILEAALEDMRAEGVSALSLHRVAQRVGMRVQSLYNYFDQKMAIYETLFARGMRQFRVESLKIMEQHGLTPKGLEAGLNYILTFAVENPVLFQLIFERPVPGFVPSEEGLSEIDQLITAARASFQEAIDNGHINPRLSAVQAHSLFVAIAHGITSLHMANEPHLPPGEGRFGSLVPLAVEALQFIFERDTS